MNEMEEPDYEIVEKSSEYNEEENRKKDLILMKKISSEDSIFFENNEEINQIIFPNDLSEIEHKNMNKSLSQNSLFQLEREILLKMEENREFEPEEEKINKKNNFSLIRSSFYLKITKKPDELFFNKKCCNNNNIQEIFNILRHLSESAEIIFRLVFKEILEGNSLILLDNLKVIVKILLNCNKFDNQNHQILLYNSIYLLRSYIEFYNFVGKGDYFKSILNHCKFLVKILRKKISNFCENFSFDFSSVKLEKFSFRAEVIKFLFGIKNFQEKRQFIEFLLE